MKTVFTRLFIFCFVLLSFVACGDDDPKDNNFFFGIYKGKISYSKGLKTIVKTNEGTVTVVKLGDEYTFKFSDDVPSIKKVKIEKGENKFNLNWNEGSVILIDAHSLNLTMFKDGQKWTANCKK